MVQPKIESYKNEINDIKEKMYNESKRVSLRKRKRRLKRIDLLMSKINDTNFREANP